MEEEAKGLEYFSRSKGALSEEDLNHLQAWLDEDWEAHDYDHEMITLVSRLLVTARRNIKRGTP